MMKKYLIMLLSVVMAVCMLSACSDYDNDNPGTTLGTTPSTPTGGLDSIGSDISSGLSDIGNAITAPFTSTGIDSGASSVPTEPTMPTDVSTDTSSGMGSEGSSESSSTVLEPNNGSDNDVVSDDDTNTAGSNGRNADSKSSDSKTSGSKTSGGNSSSKK